MHIMKRNIGMMITVSLLLTILNGCFKEDFDYITDIESYDDLGLSSPSSFYSIYLDLPSDAEVLNFSYYKNSLFNHSDIYLELKFQDVESIERYLNEIILKLEERNQEKVAPCYAKDGKHYHSEPNPYNSSYTDIFSLDKAMWSAGVNFVGYRYEPGDINNYHTYYEIISYSMEDLIIIQTASDGFFGTAKNEHLPKYLEHFNMPLSKPVERWIYVNRVESSTSKNNNA